MKNINRTIIVLPKVKLYTHYRCFSVLIFKKKILLFHHFILFIFHNKKI